MLDEEILTLFNARSENAINAIADKYGSYCWRIAGNVLKCREDIEECVNDTWLSVWNQIPPNKPNCLSSYLGKIIRNIALNKYDFLHAQKRNCALVDIFAELDEICTGNVVEEKFETGELIKLIESFLDTQKPINRNYFIKRYWFGDSIKDISSEYGVSQSKLKVTLFRMRKQLKEILEQEGVTI